MDSPEPLEGENERYKNPEDVARKKLRPAKDGDSRTAPRHVVGAPKRDSNRIYPRHRAGLNTMRKSEARGRSVAMPPHIVHLRTNV